MSCNSEAPRDCDAVKAILAFGWIGWIELTFLLCVICYLAFKAFRGGRGVQQGFEWLSVYKIPLLVAVAHNLGFVPHLMRCHANCR